MIIEKKFTGKESDSFTNSLKSLKLNKNLSVIVMEQIHGTKIFEIEDSTNMVIKGVDGCFTSNKNTVLSVKSADCLPILISGKNNNTNFIAAAHAGRKGTDGEILYKLLNRLNDTYNFNINTSLHIWFGPAICQSCYQVDKQKDLHYDLIQKNKNQLFRFLKENKISQNNLELIIENRCTLHENDQFYSYRASGPGVKMNYSLIVMN